MGFCLYLLLLSTLPLSPNWSIGEAKGLNPDWKLVRSENLGFGEARDTWVFDSSKTLGFSETTLYMSNQKISSGIFALLPSTSGISSSFTRISPSATGKFLFTPNSSQTIGLPASFQSGFKTLNPLNLSISEFTLKVDLSITGTFTGAMLVRLSKGSSPKNFTNFIAVSSVSFASGSTQLSYDVALSSQVLIKDVFCVELGMQIVSLGSSAPTITLNINSMRTTAIILPSSSNKAFARGQSNQVGFYNSPDDAGNTTQITEYGYVNVSDNVYLSRSGSASTNGRYADVAMIFKFNMTGYSSITDVTVTWEGYRSNSPKPDDNQLEIYKATSWSNWITGIGTPPFDNELPTTDTSFSKSLGDGSAYFYQTSGCDMIRFGFFMFYQKSPTTGTITGYTDFACVTITYGAVVTSYLTSSSLAISMSLHNNMIISVSSRSTLTITFSLHNKLFLAIPTVNRFSITPSLHNALGIYAPSSSSLQIGINLQNAILSYVQTFSSITFLPFGISIHSQTSQIIISVTDIIPILFIGLLFFGGCCGFILWKYYDD